MKNKIVIDYGEYTAFTNQGLDGGFFKSDAAVKHQLEQHYSFFIVKTSKSLRRKYWLIMAQLFVQFTIFTGGYRFHLLESSGNEFTYGMRLVQDNPFK